MKISKRLKEAGQLIEEDKLYTLEEAVDIFKKTPVLKFDESVELAFVLGVDPKHADQMVRGAVVLPAGSGKTKKILVLAKGDAAKQAQEAGADYVGDKDLIDKIAKGWFDFDAVVAEPAMMKEASILGKVLGPKGLMPSPKAGTVTKDTAKAVNELKAGKIEFKVNKAGGINLSIAKLSFEVKDICKNAQTVIDAIVKAKPAVSKGKYLKKLAISTTMGLGLRLDIGRIV
jgi:large subunit ribosomal protein L1